MVSRDPLITSMDIYKVGDALRGKFVEDVNDVEVLWIECDPTKAVTITNPITGEKTSFKASLPAAEWPHFERVGMNGSKVNAIIVPVYQEKYWQGQQARYGYTMKHIKVNLHLTDIEAAIVKQQPNNLHEVLLFAASPVRSRNPRTHQSELLRRGIKHVITIVVDEPTETNTAPETPKKK